MAEVMIWVLGILALLTSLPAGYFLSKICCDELAKDKKYFIGILILILLSAGLLLVFYRDLSILLSLVYMAIVFSVMILRTRNLSN